MKIGSRIPTSNFGIPLLLGSISMWAQFGILIGLNTSFYANNYIRWTLILQLSLHIKEAMATYVSNFPEIFSFDSNGRITELYILADRPLTEVAKTKLDILRLYVLPSTILKYIIIVISIHNFIYISVITSVSVIMAIIYPRFLLYPSLAYPAVQQRNIKLIQNVDQNGLWKLATLASQFMDSGIFILLLFASSGYLSPYISIGLSLIIFMISIYIINWGTKKLFIVALDKKRFVKKLEK
ncbi:MAG: hypothetical protein LBC17_00575 [Lactobacillaceae bacterium]|jgi:hypothetical protein|nr:hypothetical protein [Lactobacillaceae bacterium]